MSQENYIYTMKGFSKSINGRKIIKETWLSFIDGAKIGVVGENGSGKSTLLKIMAGIDQSYDGEIWQKEGLNIGYLAQEPELVMGKTVYENILEGLGAKKKLLDEFNEIGAKFALPMSDSEMDELMQKQATLQDEIDSVGAWDIERDIEVAMQSLNILEKDQFVDNLSGGEKRRVALCKILLSAPDLLLLDEPTNHLDAWSVSWIENYLKSYKGAVVVVTHDRYFLDNVTEWILELDNGECVPWHKNYSSWLQEKVKQENSNSEIYKEEYKWLKLGKEERASEKAQRISSYSEKYSKKDTRQNRRIFIPNGPRLGNLVIEAKNIKMSFENKTLYEDFSFKVPAGAVIGVIGPNGTGKTTLFEIISGKTNPKAGEVRLGETVKLGYVDQDRDTLDPNNTVWEEISGSQEEVEISGTLIKTRAYCSFFGFKSDAQQKKISSLSGGERGRVHMAKLLKSGSNLLLLDEPSNDLDISTLRLLESAIRNFAGCAIVISHDRWFLDRIATHLISFEEEQPVWFEGGFQEYADYLVKTKSLDITSSNFRHKKFSI